MFYFKQQLSGSVEIIVGCYCYQSYLLPFLGLLLPISHSVILFLLDNKDGHLITILCCSTNPYTSMCFNQTLALQFYILTIYAYTVIVLYNVIKLQLKFTIIICNIRPTLGCRLADWGGDWAKQVIKQL